MPEKRATVARLPVLTRIAHVDKQYLLNLSHVQRRFDRAAAGFNDSDFVHEITRNGLLDRIQAVVVDANEVIDLGTATGAALRPLARRFRGANVTALDVSRNMLEQCRQRGTWFSKPAVVQANAISLPLADQSIDIVFSNLLLPWIGEPELLAAEVSRVLRRDGLFAFTTLGPDSLRALRDAWAAIDTSAHVNRFLDMHDIGDVMVRAGLREPVLDVDRSVVTYDDANALFRDLTAVAARNCLVERRRSLSTPKNLAAIKAQLDATRVNGKIQVELELVYGHCWGAGALQRGTDVHIEPGSIPFRRR